MSRRIWIILAALLLCNAIGLAVLMADSEANAAELSAKAKANGALNTALNTKAAAAPMAAAAAFATITVTTRVDEGQPTGSGGNYASTTKCSLREAINAAQNNVATGGCAAGSSSGTDIINISLVALGSDTGAVNEEIDVERVLPDITTSLNIVGVNPNVSIIQRSHAASVPNFRLFNISSAAVVTISGVTICNGLGNMNGVAIQNGGNLTLDGVLVTANNIEPDIATPTGNGTVNNFGTMTITNSDITDNRAGVGAGIYNTNSLTISKTSISGNIAVDGAGGGLYNVGTAAITTLDRSVIKANIANDGGGIYNATGGTITLTNSSIGLNEGFVSGSAIYNEGNTPNSTINLRSVTIGKHANITGDSTHDAAIYVDANSVITYRNSIFSDGFSDGTGTFTNFLNAGGTLTSEGYNISNDSSGVLGATGDKPAGTDPLLDSAGIATYGNTTENPDRIESFRLRCGSPAIDAASNSGGTAAPANDARNVTRIGLPDIGSYEFNYQITTASPLPNFTQGVAYSVTLAAQGGDTPYFWQLASGSLPTGLSVTSLGGVGKIEGTPTQSGVFNFSIRVTDEFGTYCAITKAFTLSSTVSCSAITVNPTSLTAATCDSAYSQAITSTGGTGSVTYSVQAGSSLPAGLTLTAGGSLSGTPTVPGTYNFTIVATDANLCTGTRAYTLVVNCPVITVGVPAGTTATTGTSFSGTFTSSKAGATFTLNSGALPTGLTLSSAGVLNGTPTQSGSFPITVKATVGTCTGTSATYTLVVSVGCSAITLSNNTLPAATCDSTYAGQSITASGGTSPYTFTLNAGSSLPTGMTLTPGGVIGGTPTVVGIFSFTIKATDNNGCTGTRAYSLTVNCPVITVGLPANNTASTGNAFSATFTSSKAGSTFSLNSGALPTGVTLSPAGVLSGTPTQSGSFPITVKATAGTCTGTSATYTLAVSVTCGTITLSATSLPAATCDSAYSPQTLTASGGASPYTFTLDVGSSLPTGMTLTTGGVISGTPTVVGTFNFTIKATDNNGCNGTRAYSLIVNCPVITVGVPAGTTATTGTAFSGTFTSSKAGSTFSLNSGTLPTGLTLSSAGVLSGTPTQAGSFAITVKATAGTCTGTSGTYTLVVSCPTITLSATALPAATCDSVYTNQTITASGGSGAYSFTLNAGSSLPSGMTLSTAGVIGGTPTVVGSFSFTIKATDANGCSGTRTYSLTVNCPTITVNPSTTTLTASAGAAFSQTFTSSKTGSTFSTSSTLPTGLTLSSAGVLSGTPTQTGTFSILVTATAGTCTGSRTYSLTVNCPTITLTPTTLPGGNANTVYPNQQFSASGGGSSYTYKLLSGTLPNGLTLSGAGLLSGTPTANGTFNFTICATSVAGCTGQTAYTVIIGGGNTAPTITAGATLSRQQGNASGAAVTIATVSDAQTAAGSLTVTQIAGGTATGITLSNITNVNGTITAQVAANCTAVGGTICLQVSDGSLTAKANLTVNVTANVAPTLSYNTPDPVQTGATSTVNPATGPSDNGSISSIVLQSVTPSVTAGVITVNNSSGVVTINSTIPVGTYTIAVRATDNCGATTDASFTLNVIGSLLITEARFSGPGGVNDWYVELYNNTNSTVNTTGLKLGLLNANGTQLVSYDLPTNRTIAPRGYFLVAGSAFSLASVAAPDLSAAALAGGFNAAGAGLFRGATTDPTKRLDSLCLNSITGASTYGFYIETTAVGNVGSTTAEHAWVRKIATSGGLPIDTNVNQSDYTLISTTTTAINGLTPTLGAPSPQNITTASINNTNVAAALFSNTVDSNTYPNFERDRTVLSGSQGSYPLGSFYMRRKLTNNTGAPIKKLRLRVIDLSNGTPAGQANLRAIDATDITINGQPVKGLQLEVPPSQPNGGGINSSLNIGTITLVSPLATGASINIQLRIGILAGGSWRYVLNIEPTN